MGQFLHSINEVRKNYSKFDAWEQQQADERAKKEYLAKTLDIPQDKVELTNKRAQTIIRATEIMDARSEDNCQNMEQVTGILSAIPILTINFGQLPFMNWLDKKIRSKYDKKIEVINNEMNKKFMSGTRYDDLKSMRNEIDFLRNKKVKLSNKVGKYTPIASIMLILASAVGMILWSNSKQKEASRIGRYQAKQNELKNIENFVVYTPEQIEKAKEIAKNIPDEKEKNSISKMIKELKDVQKDKKAYKEWLKTKDPNEIEKLKNLNFTQEQLEKGREDKELIVDAVKEINIKAEEYSENVENSFDTLQTLSWLIAVPVGLGINKIMKAFKATPKVKNAVSISIPILTPIFIALFGTLEEKKASRVGRFKAREDLLKNPARLMSYTDSEMEKAKDIKAPEQKQSFVQKIGDSFAFLSKYYKDKSKYNKYKKTTQKENEKLQKALKEVEITDTQRQEAKTLQKNVFRAFDEVDEMSQRYSEDVEAGCEIAKEVGGTAWALGSLAGSVLFAVSIAKGKFPIAKITNKLANMTFDAKSPLKKAVNNVYDVLKTKDKKTVQDFQKNLVKGNLKYFYLDPKNADIQAAMNKLGKEFMDSGIKDLFAKIILSDGKFNLSQALNDTFKSHFKQTPIAKWARSLISQCSKLWIKNKAAKTGAEIPKEIQEQLGMNFNYKNYNTLINTGLVAGAPILGLIFAVPYAFNAWLTNIQKKAGKIGIMKAMDKVDDDKIFASQDYKSDENKQEIKTQSSNLLADYKNMAVKHI